MTDLSERLDKIDGKIDKLSEVVADLKKIEERIAHLISNIDHQNSKLADAEKRIRDLELVGSSRSVVISYGERFGWLVITGLVGLVIYFIKHQ